MRDHHSVSGCFLVFRPFQTSIICCMAVPTSATIGRLTRTVLFIELRSISTWILTLSGENASKRPVTRSSKRAPRQTMTSHWFMAILASYVPCMPNIPNQASPEAGYAPRPIRVDVTGAPVSSASSRSAALAAGPELMMPPPVYKIGALALAINSTARLISA